MGAAHPRRAALAPLIAVAAAAPLAQPITTPQGLAESFASQIRPRLDVLATERSDYAMLLADALRENGIRITTPQIVVPVDRSAFVQAAMLWWVAPAETGMSIGAAPASTGRQVGERHQWPRRRRAERRPTAAVRVWRAELLAARECDRGVGDVPRLDGRATAELRSVDDEGTLSAMAHELGAHACLNVAEVERAAIVADPTDRADPVDADVHRGAAEEAMRLAGDHVAVQVAQAPAGDRQLARRVAAERERSSEVVRHHPLVLLLHQRVGALLGRGADAEEQRRLVRHEASHAARDAPFGIMIQHPRLRTGHVLGHRRQVDAATQAAGQTEFAQQVHVAANRLRGDAELQQRDIHMNTRRAAEPNARIDRHRLGAAVRLKPRSTPTGCPSFGG